MDQARMSQRQMAFRADFRTRITPAYYGWAHVVLVYALGIAAIWYCARPVANPAWYEYLVIPVLFCVSNVFEWWIHSLCHASAAKGLYRNLQAAHARAPPVLHPDRTDNRITRDFRIVVFPPYALVASMVLSLRSRERSAPTPWSGRCRRLGHRPDPPMSEGARVKTGNASLIGGIALGIAGFVLWTAVAHELSADSTPMIGLGMLVTAGIGTWIRVADPYVGHDSDHCEERSAPRAWPEEANSRMRLLGRGAHLNHNCAGLTGKRPWRTAKPSTSSSPAPAAPDAW